jgi:hypothetical protein
MGNGWSQMLIMSLNLLNRKSNIVANAFFLFMASFFGTGSSCQQFHAPRW